MSSTVVSPYQGWTLDAMKRLHNGPVNAFLVWFGEFSYRLQATKTCLWVRVVKPYIIGMDTAATARGLGFTR